MQFVLDKWLTFRLSHDENSATTVIAVLQFTSLKENENEVNSTLLCIT